MTTLKRFGLASLVGALGLVPVLGSSAHADRASAGDNWGDASVYVFPGADGKKAEPAPEEALTDVRGVSWNYKRQKLVVVAEVAETSEGLTRPTRVFVRVKDKKRDFVISSNLGEVLRVQRLTKDGAKNVGKCKGGRATTNFVKDTITASIPVSCFGGADRVRVGAILTRVYSPDDFDTNYYYADDAFNSKPIQSFEGFFKPQLATSADRG